MRLSDRSFWYRPISLITIVLIVQEIGLYVWRYYAGILNVSTTLPLHLCSFVLILSVAMWLRPSQTLYDLLYIWGIAANSMALLTPNMDGYFFPHFRFFSYFLSHGTMLIILSYYTIVESYRLNFWSYLRSILYLQPLMIAAFSANQLTGGNYMYLAAKPSSSSLMDILAPWPYYIFQLDLVAIVAFFVIYWLSRRFDFGSTKTK